MSADVRSMLSEVAPRPARRLDTASIQRRGDRIRVARRVLAVALSLPLLGGLAWGASHVHLSGDPASLAPAGHLGLIADSPCEASNADVMVFLKDGAGATEASDLEHQIRNVSHVVAVVYVDKHEAWAEFKNVYRDYPRFWRHLPVDALPASLRVGVDEPSYVNDVVSVLPTPPVIDGIRTDSSNPCEELERARRERVSRQQLRARLAALRAEKAALRAKIQRAAHDRKHNSAERELLRERARLRNAVRRLAEEVSRD